MEDQSQKIAEMCRLAVADIIRSVGGVGNLLVNDNKMALIQSIAQRLEQLGVAVETILGPQLAQAYFQGITDADAFLETQGVDTKATGVNKQVHLAGVQSIVADTMQDMNASFRTALIMGVANIDNILDAVNDDIAKGMILGDPSDRIAQQVQATFAQNGMTSFITSDGKRLPLDFYAQTVVRTKMRTSHTTGATERYKESGVYHVKINEHSPTCAVCARYQGKVVALDPDHAEGFPTDIPLPPYHPNCQHTARPYVLDFHSEADIKNEKKKWDGFDPDKDVRSAKEKDFYKNEQNIRRKARQEMKEYELLKATAKPGDKIPKTLGAYRRMKRKNDDAWKELQSKYKQNIADMDGSPGPSGTPKKKKGTARGTKVATGGKPKTTPKKKKATPKKTPDKVDKPKEPTPPPVDKVDTTPSGPKLSPADQKAHQEFDRIIDGIETGNIKNMATHVLSRSEHTKDLTPSIKSNTGSAGYCTTATLFKKAMITDYVLDKSPYTTHAYNAQTVFHEYFHANMNGLPMPHARGTDYAIGGDRWTSLEETITECSGIFMTNRAGLNYNGETPAYSDYLINNLPRMKQMPDFQDCETLSDFGAKFMKYRFDPDHRTVDWKPLDDELQKIPPHDPAKYAKKHYDGWIKDNEELVKQKIFDILPQDKAGKESQYKDMIWSDIKSAMDRGDIYDQWYKTAVGLAMNTIGVKNP